MGIPDVTRHELRDASLRLVEAASALATAISDIRYAVLALHHIVAGSSPSADPHERVRQSLNDATTGLAEAYDSLDAAGRTLGATDD